MMGTRKLQSLERCCGKGDQSPRVKKGKKPYFERKVWECFQWKAHGQCSNGDSCSFSHDTMASGDSGEGQRRKGRSSSPASHSKSKQTDGAGQTFSQGSGNKQEYSFDKRKVPFRFKFCKNPSCKFWRPPVRLNYKSEKGCVYGDKYHFRGKESVATLKESIHLGCVSKDSYPRKSFRHESGKFKSKHTVKFSKGTWHEIKNRECKGPSQTKNCHLINIILAHRNSRKDHMRMQSSVGFGEKASDFGQTVFHVPGEVKGNAGAHFTETRGARIRSWFRSIDAHDEQERIKLIRDGHSKKVQKPNSSVYC